MLAAIWVERSVAARASATAPVLGGLQVGGVHQFAPNWVAGIEGQYSWLPGSASHARVGPFDLTRDRNALGSLTGRLGYAAGPTLLYVKGGYAYQDTTYGVRSVAGPAAFTLDGGKKNGYTIGGGLEYLVSPNWSTSSNINTTASGARICAASHPRAS